MTTNRTIEKKDVQAGRRTLVQSAALAISDVYDAATELVTNADDRYQYLGTDGKIEIEVERRRGRPSLFRVRDFADGMTREVMNQKLAVMGGRVSGFSEGIAVRGTNSRGAKDVSSLGRVTFQSIAGDGKVHACSISQFMEFELYESEEASKRLRQELGIPRGTGTLVTIELDEKVSIPQHGNLHDKLQSLVSLRDIVADPRRTVILRDVTSSQKDRLRAPSMDGTDRVNMQLEVPGYPEAKAKLTILRAHKRFEKEAARFRKGGILVKSRHGIHEATLFDAGLESDPHARWFYGRLKCEYIDELSDEYDERFEQGLQPSIDNPWPILDPSRKSGLTRDHPFAKALSGEVLKRLRPLVEEERKRAETQQTAIENRATRQRLNRLEAAAVKFMEKYSDEEARDTSAHSSTSQLLRSGYQLNPPFSQLLRGHSIRMSLNVNQETFLELEVGATVQIDCHDDAISTSKRYAALEPHPQHENMLRATWKVTGEEATEATGVRVRVGPITADAAIEVLATEADRYRHIQGLTFQRKRYTVRTGGKRKRVRLLAPLEAVPSTANVAVSISGAGRQLRIANQPAFERREDLGVALCEIVVKSGDESASGTLSAQVDGHSASATIESIRPPGFGIKIKLQDIDLQNQRYRWRQNVLEIAARHPSLSRYLGDEASGFPGQDEPHFRLLLAEIVSDAVCAQMLTRSIQDAPEDYEDADWDDYYAEYSKLMTGFLPIAHGIQYPK